MMQVDLPPFPSCLPPGFKENNDEPQYDPAIHLDLQLPQYVYMKDTYEKVAEMPKAQGNELSSLAFTEPFKILSEQGLIEMKKILAREEKLAKESIRQPKTIRGLAYNSKFIRDFNRCPIVLQAFSKMAGMDLLPHTFFMSYSHVNVGEIGERRQVDQWHRDSVDFVCVILGSDLTGAIGGELELIKKPVDEAFQILKETNNNVPEEHLLKVNYKAPGYCIFMQGSQMVHHATAVKNAKENRITIVNSYMPANPYVQDQTILYTFRDEPQTANHEYAIHKSWKASQKLKQLMKTEEWPNDKSMTAQKMREVALDLLKSADIVEGKVIDRLDFFKENQNQENKM